MQSQPEKRRQHRAIRQDPMVYTVFSLRHWAERDARSLNLSRSGVGFLAARPLAPKTIVCIRSTPNEKRKDLRDQNAQIPLRALAEVRWCRRRRTIEGPMYEIGASFL